MPLERQPAAIEFLLRARLALAQRAANARVWVVERDNEIIGTVALVIGSGAPPSLLDKIRAGLLALPLRFGVPTLQRLETLITTFDATRVVTPADTVRADLQVMTTDPRVQGSGVGTRLLRFALAFARAQGVQRAYLDTQLERAKTFYERKAGFQLLQAHQYFSDTEHEHTSWQLMLQF